MPDFARATWAKHEADDEAMRLAQEAGDAIAGRGDETWELDASGCPQSHMLGEFAQSLVPYLGARGFSMPRQRSMLLERAMMRDDVPNAQLLWEAVQLYEAHEDGAYARASEALDG